MNRPRIMAIICAALTVVFVLLVTHSDPVSGRTADEIAKQLTQSDIFDTQLVSCLYYVGFHLGVTMMMNRRRVPEGSTFTYGEEEALLNGYVLQSARGVVLFAVCQNSERVLAAFKEAL